MKQRTRDRVLGTLYGQAIGDALGMPTELWPIATIQRVFPQGITTFVDGPASNVVAKNYRAGEYTDDTGQALKRPCWQSKRGNQFRRLRHKP